MAAPMIARSAALFPPIGFHDWWIGVWHAVRSLRKPRQCHRVTDQETILWGRLRSLPKEVETVRYPKECVLKECVEAVIRPLESGDRLLLDAFYKKVPESDRWFMNHDVMDASIMDTWFDAVEKGSICSILALCKETVVGQGSLYLRGFGATSHVGRFRIVVLPEFRQKRLGTWLLLDLIQLAMDRGLEMLRADLVSGAEDAAIEAVHKFDFFKYAEMKDYVKDVDGNRQDLLIMVKRLHKEWSDF
jgi:L-amino acid N-acyltransferase YncA